MKIICLVRNILPFLCIVLGITITLIFLKLTTSSLFLQNKRLKADVTLYFVFDVVQQKFKKSPKLNICMVSVIVCLMKLQPWDCLTFLWRGQLLAEIQRFKNEKKKCVFKKNSIHLFMISEICSTFCFSAHGRKVYRDIVFFFFFFP